MALYAAAKRRPMVEALLGFARGHDDDVMLAYHAILRLGDALGEGRNPELAAALRRLLIGEVGVSLMTQIGSLDSGFPEPRADSSRTSRSFGWL
jgi:hypothetical protein